MTQQYIGEIRTIAFGWAPPGWALCEGQLLSIAENQDLFNVIGTTFGGDGLTTFAVPDLRGRVPAHFGNLPLGGRQGRETVTLTATQIPVHAHTPVAATAGSAPSPANNVWAGATPLEYLTPPATTGQMASNALAVYGGDQPHDNMLPFVAVSFMIALAGLAADAAPVAEGGASENAGAAWMQYLSEIRMMAFGHAPAGWAPCDGQILPIHGNEALFSLLGTTFGGDGRVNFALPNLRDRVPISMGRGYTLGQQGGGPTVTLTPDEMPPHTHVPAATNDAATTGDPTGGRWANAGINNYAPSSNVSMAAADVNVAGGNQAHENLSPELAMCFCIALTGTFPSSN